MQEVGKLMHKTLLQFHHIFGIQTLILFIQLGKADFQV